MFGVRSEQEVARSLSLLGVDPDDEQLRRRLLEFSAGRCLLRDHQGRIEAVQVDICEPAVSGRSVDHAGRGGDGLSWTLTRGR